MATVLNFKYAAPFLPVQNGDRREGNKYKKHRKEKSRNKWHERILHRIGRYGEFHSHQPLRRGGLSGSLNSFLVRAEI